MSRLGIVIFGATGFTGKHAAIEMVRLAKKHPGLTWGVAGRSQSKLEDLMRHVSETTGEDQGHVKIIIADVGDEESLKQMCTQAKVIANCCGPYRLYGEPVVKAAIACHTHLVDVTGEPQFIETMFLKYHKQAQENGVYVISSCGYDSIPNDMGVIFLQQNFGGTVNSIESYMSSQLPREYLPDARKHGAIHYGTWESLVYGLAYWDELKPLRQKMFPDRLPTFKPKLMPRRVLHTRNGEWCVPFPGADNSIVYRSQRHLYEHNNTRPAQFKVYFNLKNFLPALLLIIGGIFFAIMARFRWTRSLLLQHPRFFSGGFVTREGPTRAVTEHTKFKMELFGEGWAEGTDVSKPTDKKLVARVSGTNPGYGATVISLLYSAITILEESQKMPDKGGVLTTAIAFKDTNLIKNLNENGVKFEIVDAHAMSQ